MSYPIFLLCNFRDCIYKSFSPFCFFGFLSMNSPTQWLSSQSFLRSLLLSIEKRAFLCPNSHPYLYLLANYALKNTLTGLHTTTTPHGMSEWTKCPNGKKMTFLNTFSTKEKWPLLARCFDYYQLSCGQNYSNIHSFTFLKFSCIGNAFGKFQSSCGCENSTQQVLVLKLYLYINGLKMI